MTADQFLLCLRRFIARSGKPKLVISDNAPQYKLTKSTFDEAWQFATTHPETQSYLANEEMKWKFLLNKRPEKEVFTNILWALWNSLSESQSGKSA